MPAGVDSAVQFVPYTRDLFVLGKSEAESTPEPMNRPPFYCGLAPSLFGTRSEG